MRAESEEQAEILMGRTMTDKKSAAILVSSFTAMAAILLVSASQTRADRPATSAQPVVVELFTSQGCSSCPPADAFVEELATQSDVVAITRPVTYWDRLGWKDTLARPENTELQRAYAARGGEGAGVYTPQIMVQGRFGAVGSNRGVVQNGIARARSSVTAAIAVRPGLLAIAGKGGPADVRLVGLRSHRIVRIGDGENGGRTIRYSNIVMGERLIGKWNGNAQTFELPALNISGADRYAVIAQSGTGPILAGRYL
jgi:hypothetical protein